MNDLPPAASTIQLLRETASGPISAVFVGSAQTRLGRRFVAIKLLRELPDGGVDRLLDLRDRARPLGLLDHKHLVPTLDVARVDERFALVSPFIDGLDLLDWLDLLGETGRVLPRRVSCEILRSIASALEAAARRDNPLTGAPIGLVHRDLKPSNVMITRDGTLRVTDFGTGYTALAGRAARAGALKKGLVRYLSPERRDGERATPSSDIYALGILSVELFRGKWLRRLRTKNPAHDRQLADVVARLEDLQMKSDSDDRGLRNLLLRMVAFDADARPEIGEVVNTLRTMTDRAEGPSLESYALAHAVPWMDEIPREPEPGLADARATIVERGQPLPPAGGGLPVVTLPDRYDLQVASNENDTGEWSYEEVTDPRLRQTPPAAQPRDADATPSELPGAAVAKAPLALETAQTEARLAPLPPPAPAVAEPLFVDDGLHGGHPDPEAAFSQVSASAETAFSQVSASVDVAHEITPTEEISLPLEVAAPSPSPRRSAEPTTAQAAWPWLLIIGAVVLGFLAAVVLGAVVLAIVFFADPSALP